MFLKQIVLDYILTAFCFVSLPLQITSQSVMFLVDMANDAVKIRRVGQPRPHEVGDPPLMTSWSITASSCTSLDQAHNELCVP